MLYVSKLEFENLLYNGFSLLGTAAYGLLILAVSLSEELQEGYFAITGSLPVTLIDFVLPVFFVVILCARLVPSFAGEAERSANQIPAACYLGRKGRNAAKLIASLWFALFVGSVLIALTLVVCFLCGYFSNGTENVLRYLDDTELKFCWNVWQHFGYGAVCLLMGGAALALFVLFVSSHAKNTITAVGTVAIAALFEFLCNRFSTVLLLREYNLCVFFRPYYLYMPNILRFSPCINLLVFALLFLPLCALAAWRTVEKGGVPG